MAEHHGGPLSHVIDHTTLELPVLGTEIPLPNIMGFQITRFMVMEVLVAALMCLILIPLARHVARQRVTRGRLWNIFETIVLFIRDGIARPSIDGGHEDHGPIHDHPVDLDESLVDLVGIHDDVHGNPPDVIGPGSPTTDHSHHKPHAKHGRLSDKYLPYLWTVFFFVLFCNLLGMIPGCASATGDINVTGTMALLTFSVVIFAGMRQMGPLGFFTNLVPKMDVPIVLKPFLWILMFIIELAGLLIKHIVLSVRLFANMLAGHIVIATILGFVALGAGLFTWMVTPASILGAVAISMLELLVAFLQAYIFTFLSALFIGSVVHSH